MNRTASIVLKAIGCVAILCAVLGLFYNFTSFSTLAAKPAGSLPNEDKVPYFYPAFHTMSAICVCFYGALLFFGVEFLRGRTGHLKKFTALLIVEVAYYFLVGLLWLVPGIGMSVAAATGVANGGLVVQLIILFPLWAPFAAIWAKKRLPELPPVI